MPFCTNPTLSHHKRKIRADSRNKCMWNDPARRCHSNRARWLSSMRTRCAAARDLYRRRSAVFSVAYIAYIAYIIKES